MGDLISRSEVMETLRRVFNQYNVSWNPQGKREGDFSSAVPNAIMEIPTAYDPEKVVEQLEEKAKHAHVKFWAADSSGKEECYYDGMVGAFDDAIEIVKGGGIDGKNV